MPNYPNALDAFAASASKLMITAIIHTNPIRQLGRSDAFDLAQPRHDCELIVSPLRSSIGGENDNMTVSFKAGAELQAAMVSAVGARLDLYAGAVEFSGTIQTVEFDGNDVNLGVGA